MKALRRSTLRDSWAAYNTGEITYRRFESFSRCQENAACFDKSHFLFGFAPVCRSTRWDFNVWGRQSRPQTILRRWRGFVPIAQKGWFHPKPALLFCRSGLPFPAPACTGLRGRPARPEGGQFGHCSKHKQPRYLAASTSDTGSLCCWHHSLKKRMEAVTKFEGSILFK